MRQLFFLLLLSCSPHSEGFSYPCSQEDNGTAKRVLIIGDSISIGYSPFVINRLCSHGIFVTRIPVNGRGSAITLSHIDLWLGKKTWDVVTFNVGIWDLPASARTEEELEARVLQYKENLRGIYRKIAEKSNVVLFFNTTKIDPTFGLIRASDVLVFNQAAEEALESLRLEESRNLYDESLPLPQSDGLHFNKMGYSTLAKFVQKNISSALEGTL